MAIGVYFHPGPMTTAQYDDVIAEIGAARFGRPAGRISRRSSGPDDNLTVFRYPGEQALDQFGKVLTPIMQKQEPTARHPMCRPYAA